MSNSGTWPDPDSQLAGHGRKDVRGVYLVDPTTNKAYAASGGGGGGGAVTIADGADVTQGTTTQTKATDGSTTSWSVIQLLKGIFDRLLNGIAVTGTFWQATQPVSAASLPLPTGAAQEAGGNLATLVTDMTELLTDTDNLANIPAKGANTVANSTPITNAAVQGWIAASGTGTASQDDSLTFASQVRKVVLYNASANPVPFEFDQTSAATSIPIQPGQYMVFDDVLCTVVHVFPSATLPINTTSGLYVKGWK